MTDRIFAQVALDATAEAIRFVGGEPPLRFKARLEAKQCRLGEQLKAPEKNHVGRARSRGTVAPIPSKSGLRRRALSASVAVPWSHPLERMTGEQ